MGKGEREYGRVIQDKYFHCKNRVVFEPQEKNPQGEIHEDWGFYSFDSTVKKGKLRVFYNEGYISLYTLEKLSPEGKELVFLTCDNENLPEGFRARITLKLLTEEELTEKFELASPGKDFGICIENFWFKVS